MRIRIYDSLSVELSCTAVHVVRRAPYIAFKHNPVPVQANTMHKQPYIWRLYISRTGHGYWVQPILANSTSTTMIRAAPHWRCEMECDSQKIAMQSDLDRAKKNVVVCMRFPCVHECMHLRTVFQCAIKDLRLYAISFYLSRGTRFVLLSAYAIRLSFP